MDWDQPIGLGKAGNNPYALGAFGTNIATGGRGLIPMLASAFTGTGNDLQTAGKFVAASEAQEKPVTDIPREGGMLPKLLMRAGILSPYIHAPQSVMDLETLALRDQKQKRLSDILQSWHGLAEITNLGGPTFAGQVYANTPGMSEQLPGFDSSKIQTPEMLKAKIEDERIRADQAREDQRQQQLENMALGLEIQGRNAEANMIRAQADAERANAIAAAKYHDDAQQKYRTWIGQLGANSRGLFGPTAEEYRQAQNFMQDAQARKIDPEDAYAEAHKRFPNALMDEPPQQQSSAEGPGLMSKLGTYGAGALDYLTSPNPGAGAPSAAPGAVATPNVVPPRYTK